MRIHVTRRSAAHCTSPTSSRTSVTVVQQACLSCGCCRYQDCFEPNRGPRQNAPPVLPAYSYWRGSHCVRLGPPGARSCGRCVPHHLRPVVTWRGLLLRHPNFRPLPSPPVLRRGSSRNIRRGPPRLAVRHPCELSAGSALWALGHPEGLAAHEPVRCVGACQRRAPLPIVEQANSMPWRELTLCKVCVCFSGRLGASHPLQWAKVVDCGDIGSALSPQ
jgi:hypothetical protein